MEIPMEKPIEEEKKLLPPPPLPGLANIEIKKKFRVRGKYLALTYPKCTVPIKEVFLNIQHKVPTATFVKVVREKHEDGSPHFHAIIQNSHVMDIKNQAWFDIRNHHPNIQRVNDAEAWNRYLDKDKEEPDFQEMSAGVFESVGMKKIKKTREKNALYLKTSVRELVDSGEIPLIQLPLLKKAIDFYHKESQIFNKQKKLPLPEELEFCFEPADSGAMEMKYKVDLAKKRCHLWVTSPPDYGKTTWARFLLKTFRAEVFNPFNNQTEISRDTQIYIMDEITEKTKPDMALLDTICDGLGYVNAKYQGFTMDHKVLVIILSNKSLEELYPMEDNAPVNARFNFLDLEKCKFYPASAGTINYVH
ncbi:Rep [uncultured virus]|uniref:Rep n=1 Tax=uncultured virus TaxID=340016 RepID=A0A2K9LUL4_9VIRU|nr:Rep [uncultured virus]